MRAVLGRNNQQIAKNYAALQILDDGMTVSAVRSRRTCPQQRGWHHSLCAIMGCGSSSTASGDDGTTRPPQGDATDPGNAGEGQAVAPTVDVPASDVSFGVDGNAGDGGGPDVPDIADTDDLDPVRPAPNAIRGTTDAARGANPDSTRWDEGGAFLEVNPNNTLTALQTVHDDYDDDDDDDMMDGSRDPRCVWKCAAGTVCVDVVAPSPRLLTPMWAPAVAELRWRDHSTQASQPRRPLPHAGEVSMRLWCARQKPNGQGQPAAPRQQRELPRSPLLMLWLATRTKQAMLLALGKAPQTTTHVPASGRWHPKVATLPTHTARSPVAPVEPRVAHVHREAVVAAVMAVMTAPTRLLGATRSLTCRQLLPFRTSALGMRAALQGCRRATRTRSMCVCVTGSAMHAVSRPNVTFQGCPQRVTLFISVPRHCGLT